MTIRDLTDKQVKALQDTAKRKLSSRLKQLNKRGVNPTEGQWFRDGFSDGVKATLELFAEAAKVYFKP